MKTIEISILVGALVIGGTTLYSHRDRVSEGKGTGTVIADDLRIKPNRITKELVHSVVTDPANYERLKNIRGFDIDPKSPLYILATLDDKGIAVGYNSKAGDGTDLVVELGFEPDQYGRYVTDTKPPIYLNK